MAQIITFAIFGGFGFVLLYVGTTQFFQQKRLLSRAETVDAVITHSEVFTSVSADTDGQMLRSNSTTSHRPDVKFRYTLAGHEYESDLLHPTIIVRSYASRESAADALTAFPVNARVRAFVDPELPDKAYLVAESSSAPMVFVILGVLLPPLAWFVGAYV